MSRETWSAPFWGVQHLEGLKRDFQITLSVLGVHATARGNVDGGTTAFVIVPGGGFTSAYETYHPSLVEAKEWAENIAKQLGALT